MREARLRVGRRTPVRLATVRRSNAKRFRQRLQQIERQENLSCEKTDILISCFYRDSKTVDLGDGDDRQLRSPEKFAR